MGIIIDYEQYYSGEKGGYVRQCPNSDNNAKCKGELVYKDYYSFVGAIARNILCLSCSVKRVHVARQLTDEYGKAGWYRQCPECGLQLEYKTKSAFTRAERNGNICLNCEKKHHQHACPNPKNNPNCRDVTQANVCISCASYQRPKTREEIEKMLETKRHAGNYGVETRRKNGTLKHTEDGRRHISEGQKLSYTNGTRVSWNIGLTAETDTRVAKTGKSRPGELNPMSGRSYYDMWVNKFGKDFADEMNKECSKNKSHSYESYLRIYGDEGIAQEKYKEYRDKVNNLHLGYSMISQELFDAIRQQMGDNEEYYYATEKHEWCIKIDYRCAFLDFYIRNRQKAIEFYGDMWHANPAIYHDDSQIHPFMKVPLAEIRLTDENRINLIKNDKSVKDILIIWELDYIKNKQATIQKCIKFLND